MKYKLFGYQAIGMKQVLAALKEAHRVIVGWYTGSGKTTMFLELAKDLAAQGYRVGISTYLQTNIRDQVAAEAAKLGVVCGVIQNGEIPDEAILLFNPQSLYRAKVASLKFDYLIVDESHEATSIDSKMMATIVEKHCTPKVKIVGFSATAWDLPDQPLWKNAKVLVRGLNQGIVDGQVQPFVIKLEHFDIELTSKDYNVLGDVKEKFQKKHAKALRRLTKTKMELLINKHDKDLGNKVLVVCPKGDNCAMAKYVHSMYPETSLLLTGEDKDEAKILARFKKDPNIRFLVVVSKCRVGFNMPELTSVVDMSLTRNIKALVQCFGRLARLHPKKFAKRYFYVSNQGMSKTKARALFTLALRFACGDYSREVNDSGKKGDILGIPVPQPRQAETSDNWDIRDLIACLEKPKLSSYHMVRFNADRPTDEEMMELAVAFDTPKWKAAQVRFAESMAARGIEI